jgi:hypothetical protein
MRSTTTTIITEGPLWFVAGQWCAALRLAFTTAEAGRHHRSPTGPAPNHVAVSVGDQEPAEATGLSKDLRGCCFPSGLAPAGSFNAY